MGGVSLPGWAVMVISATTLGWGGDMIPFSPSRRSQAIKTDILKSSCLVRLVCARVRPLHRSRRSGSTPQSWREDPDDGSS